MPINWVEARYLMEEFVNASYPPVGCEQGINLPPSSSSLISPNTKLY